MSIHFIFMAILKATKARYNLYHKIQWKVVTLETMKT